MNILLVEDGKLYAQVLSEALASFADVQLISSQSAAAALSHLKQHEVAFVVIAGLLPDRSSMELAREIRATKRAGELPIFLLTSNPNALMAAEAARVGVTELFRKQDLDELITFLHRYLRFYQPLNCRILYVEDALDQQQALVAELTSWGAKVDAYVSADEAWLALQERHYDLLLTDVVVSGRMSGAHLINRIRRQSAPLGNLPICAVSAFDEACRRIELFHLGVDDYLPKPILPSELRARLRSLLDRHRALERSEMLLAATALGVVVTDDVSRILTVDGNARAILGGTERELVGQNLHEFVQFPQDEELHAASDVHLGREARLCLRAQVRARRLDGRSLPVELSLVPDGSAAFVGRQLFLLRDLSQEHDLQQHLRRAKESAELLARQKSEFLANMSHEIRTPVHGMLGFAQVGLRQAEAHDDLKGTFRRIIHSGQLLQRLVDDVLDFSRTESGTLLLTHQPFDLFAEVQLVLEQAGMLAEAKGLELKLELAPDVPVYVQGDPVRLNQILMNVLGNAIKFSQIGFVSLQIVAEQGRLIFTVIDTGIGMDASTLERLFKPFEQADASLTRKYGGAGLGLAMTHRLVQLMGGEIRVRSTLGLGSTVVLSLPLVEYDGATLPQAVSPDTVRVEDKPLLGRRILVVEDIETNRMIMDSILREAGAEVILAEDGQAALTWLEHTQGACDLVLMDVMMPVMDGKTAARAIARRHPGLPVVAQSAHAQGGDRAACLESGMVDHVCKPIDPDLLLEVLLKWLPEPSPVMA